MRKENGEEVSGTKPPGDGEVAEARHAFDAKVAEAKRLTDPGQWDWGPLPPGERERRLAVLADIGRRIEKDGPRVARPDSSRGRQFMPFAALEDMEDWLENAQRRCG